MVYVLVRTGLILIGAAALVAGLFLGTVQLLAGTLLVLIGFTVVVVGIRFKPEVPAETVVGRANPDSDNDSLAVGDLASQQAERHRQIINESLHLANDSANLDTKISRLDLAKQHLEMLKSHIKQYDHLSLTNLDQVEVSIAELEAEFKQRGYKEIAQRNLSGQGLEKAGDINGAIEVYETALDADVDTPFPYRRLAILYRKQKRREDEVRVIKHALKNIGAGNTKHYQWFSERLAKFVE